MLDEAAILTEIVDDRRLEANGKLSQTTKSAQGQFMTPAPVAQFMASLFGMQTIDEVRLLDAGAGIGSLTAAFVKELCERQTHIRQVAATSYEIDPMLAQYLRHTLEDCAEACERAGIAFTPVVIERDFIEAGTEQLAAPLFNKHPRFTHAILNPPYKKIHSASKHRRQLRSIGVETSNLYTAFLAIAIKLLSPGGELVAITPRSFCNGPYFRPFRKLLLDEMSLQRVHVFESRTHAFRDDDVLQENIIFHAVKSLPQVDVCLSSSFTTNFADATTRTVPFHQIVSPTDPEQFIHLTVNRDDHQFIVRMSAMPCTLQDLGIEVSTGPVVDFRLKEYLRSDPEPGTVALIYPAHFKHGFIVWPQRNQKKSNAIMNTEPVQKWLYPKGDYVLVRRFSSKEERRRVVAAICDAEQIPGDKIGFENHVNVFHRERHGLSSALARGLAVYLNSTLFDVCFRQFNGHTQVNVKDLYALRYPDQQTLETLGARVQDHQFPSQQQIDVWIEDLFP